jgi:hypothetical protein
MLTMALTARGLLARGADQPIEGSRFTFAVPE